jgi:membrane protease YdiL (CAAX protease family)
VRVAFWTFVAATLAGVASACAFLLAAPGWTAKHLSDVDASLEPILTVDSLLQAALMLALVTVLPAVCEELAFRGFLQRVLRSGWSVPVAIGVTSVLFAASHLDAVGRPTRVLIGVASGLCYERTGSLRLSMLVHGTHNLLVMLLTPWSDDDPLAHLTRGQAALGLAVTLPGALVAGRLWWRTLKRLPPAAEP